MQCASGTELHKVDILKATPGTLAGTVLSFTLFHFTPEVSVLAIKHSLVTE